MAELAGPAHAPAAAKAAEAPRRAEPGERHAALEARPEVETELNHGEMLNGRPALDAQRKAATRLAGRAPGPRPVQRAAPPNRTGLPDRLKSGVETLSGVSLDGVRVHYNSAKPAELNAHAYAQGSDIHLAPGQEKHLPHEAWHVVQQARGRAKPTRQMKGIGINDDAALEREADAMGARAMAFRAPAGGAAAVSVANGPIADAAVQLRAAGDPFTQPEAARLNPLPQINHNAVNLNALAAGSARSAADLETLAGLRVAGIGPTLQEMIDIEAAPLARISALAAANLAQVLNWADLRQLAALNRTVQDIVQLANVVKIGDQSPTLAQIVAFDRFSNAEVNLLYRLDQVQSWDDLGQLSALGRNPADVGTLAALQVEAATPTIADMVALDAVPLAKIQALTAANLAQVHDWAELRQLAVLTRSAAHLVRLATEDFGGAPPTLAQLVALDRWPFAELNALAAIDQTMSWEHMAQLAATGRTSQEIVAVSNVQVQGAKPTMPQLLLSLGTLHQALRQQLVRMQARLTDDLDLLEDALGGRPQLQNYASILVDLNLPGLVNQGYQADKALFIRYLQSSVNYNACFDGAARLVDTFGTEALARTYESGGGPRAEYALAVQTARGQLLAQHLQQAAQSGVATLFRIHMGGHGFVMVVESNQVYQLETLAGSAAIGTLFDSIRRAQSYPIATAAAHMTAVTSNSAGQRGAASGALGWNPIPILILADVDTPKDPMTVYWTASALASRADLITIFAAKIEANRREMLTRLGADID